jgi:hypothetical protein
LKPLYLIFGIITAITVAVASISLFTTEDKAAYNECLSEIERKLVSPSSYSLDSYRVSSRKRITSSELAAMEKYRYRMGKGSEIQSGRLPQNDILYSYHQRNFEQAQFWMQEADNNNLWTTAVRITYDAENSYGASIRGLTWCDIIWTGESLKSAITNYSVYDKRSAQVDVD